MDTVPLSAQRQFLDYQYSNSENLRIRLETHREYSQGTESYEDDLLAALGLSASGLSLLDVGCGSAEWHRRLVERGAIVTGIDLSAGMLREAAAAVQTLHPRRRLAQADALALPFPDGSFDRVFCCGVMYHIADPRRALEEMRRVLAPGGVSVITANGANAMQHIHAVHSEAAEELGYTPRSLSAEAFTMDDLPLIQQVFPSASRIVLQGALVFPTVEPALRFYATNRIDGLADRPADDSHRAKLLPLVRAKIERIIAVEGAFRVPKDTGWFVARVPHQ